MCEYSQYDQVNSSRTYCLSDNMALHFRHARSSATDRRRRYSVARQIPFVTTKVRDP